MRTIVSAALLCLAIAAPAFAADKPPSDESIRHLMTVTESKKLIDNAIAMVDSSIENGMKSALAGRPVDARTQGILDEARTRMVAVMREALAWQELEPLMMQVYQRSLSQDEVNGMLKFYESDAGKAVIRKLPLIQQNTMELMQARMKDLMPKIAEIQRDAVAKMQAHPAE